jgi:hypothetical protein
MEFAGGLMQGVAMHRERARQEVMAQQAQQQARAFQMEQQAQRDQYQTARDREGRDWDTMMLGKKQGFDLEREKARRAQDQADAGVQQDFYEGAGLLPSETQMPEGVQGPGLRPARLPTREGVDAAASRYGAAQGRQMTQADREADNERADASLEQRAGTAAEMAAYRQKSLGLREQAQQGTQAYRDKSLGLGADRLAEMKRGAAERKAARDAAVKRLTPDQQIKVDQWDRELNYLYKLRDDEELRITEGWTAQQVLDEIANAEGEQRKIVGSVPQQPANADPVSAMTDEQLRALIGS